MKRATVLDVAAAAEVGASTVSRYLRGVPVRPMFAERIAKAVQELDYEPDEMARSLRGGRSRTVGVLFPKVSNAYFSHALQRIEEISSEHGYTVALLTHNDDPQGQLNDLLTLRRCRVEGVILTAMPGTTLQDIRQVLRSEPIVALDSFFSPELDSILLQNRKSAAIATRHLIKHGSKRVACVTTKPDIYSYRERINGYAAEMKTHHFPTELIVANDGARLSEMLRKQLSTKNRPDALLALSDTVVLQILQLYQELKLSPKQRPRLIGFDDFESAPFLEVPLTVIRQPVREMVDSAMSSLLRQVKRHEPHAALTVSLAGELIIRKSCGCS